MTFIVENYFSNIFVSVKIFSRYGIIFLTCGSPFIIIHLFLLNVFMRAFYDVFLLNLHFKNICHGRYFLTILRDYILSLPKLKYDFGKDVVTTLD